MALINEYYNSQYDIAIADCYWKIGTDNGYNGDKSCLHVTLKCYRNKEIADTNGNEFDAFVFDFPPDLKSNDNFLVQAYNFAKTLPKFAKAVDA